MSFDPIIDKAVGCCNRQWTELPGLILMTTRSQIVLLVWYETPTKDKKLKPVIHVMASIATRGICWICPDKLHDLYQKRLNPSLNHRAITSNQKTNRKHEKGKNRGGERTVRGRCIFCCLKCDNLVEAPCKDKHSRTGR